MITKVPQAFKSLLWKIRSLECYFLKIFHMHLPRQDLDLKQALLSLDHLLTLCFVCFWSFNFRVSNPIFAKYRDLHEILSTERTSGPGAKGPGSWTCISYCSVTWSKAVSHAVSHYRKIPWDEHPIKWTKLSFWFTLKIFLFLRLIFPSFYFSLSCKPSLYFPLALF